MAHRHGQLCAGDLDIADRLPLDLFAVNGQRHGHRTEIFRLRQRIQRAGLAGIGQLIPHLIAGIGVQRTGGFEQALLAGHVDQFLRDLTRQADRLGYIRHIGHVLAEHCLEKNVAHHHQGQAHL